MKMKRFQLLIRTFWFRIPVIILLACSCNTKTIKDELNILTVPAGEKYTAIDQSGTTILPSGRFLTPAGEMVRITSDPFGMAVSPDGKKVVTLHNGVFTVIDPGTMRTLRIPDYIEKIKSPFSNGSFLGVAFLDSKTICISGGDNGAVLLYDIENLTRVDSISLNGMIGDTEFVDSFTSDLVYNEKNNEILVLDRANFRMVRINAATRELTASVKVGRQPFGL